MKLNESKEMWFAAMDKYGYTWALSSTESFLKYQAEQLMGVQWVELSRLGWQCIPVNVLITPKEGQHTVNTEKVP